MATPETLTRDLYERRLRLQNIVVVRTQALWGRIPFGNLDGGWDQFGPEITQLVTNGQLASATLTDPYVTGMSRLSGFQEMPSATDPRLYAGIAPDGRELEPLLYGAVTTTKKAVGSAGFASMAQGAAFLAAAVKSAIADVGRMSDMSLSIGRGYKSYIRAVSPNACARCAILAGMYSSAVAFQRHPNCQCVAVPVPNLKRAKAMGFDASPEEYFSSLSVAEQNRIFTVAGAKAIREGADIYQVVNVRRGASGIAYGGRSYTPDPNSGRRMQPVQIGWRPNGQPLLVYATSEGTTARGFFGRSELARREAGHRSTTLRLMPEQIFRMAGNNPERARELLIRYGYIFV